MKIHTIAFILLIVGGLAWGLEVLGFSIGSYLPSMVTTVVYALVGVSALYEVFTHKSNCRNCAPQGSSM